MRVLLLLSGGLDSPVAARLLQEQGADLAAVHFSLEPFTDRAPEEKCLAVASRLGIPAITVVRAGPAFAELTKLCDHRLYFVLSKRLMLKVAARIAEGRGFDAIATGENLGQVSSQTLPNLATIDAATAFPVLRPLLAWDKSEIVDVARRIGTFDVSKGPEVCDVLGPDRPLTRSAPWEAEREEAKLPAGIVDALVDGAREVAVSP